MNGVNPRIAELEAENARLREKLADLEFASGRQWRAPLCLKLMRKEEMFLAALMARDQMVSVQQIYRFLYADCPDQTPLVENNVHSYASKLRRKLRARGITLSCERYIGYWLDPSSRQKVLDLFAGDAAFITVEVPKWVPEDLHAEYDRHARRFGEFYAARVIRRQLHPTAGHHAHA